MGIAAVLVKRHIYRLKEGEIFTTRDLLAYGKRSAIDNLTYRLVKKGQITRLAYGVFCKTWVWNAKATAHEIAEAKMKAWGKRIWLEESPDESARKHNLSSDLILSVSGSSSSFKTYLNVKVKLRARGQRRMKLGETPIGVLARNLWNAERSQFTERVAEDVLRRIPRAERTNFFALFRLVPAWITDRYWRDRIRHFGPRLSDFVFSDASLPTA